MVLAKTTGSKEGRTFPVGVDSSACVRVRVNRTGALPRTESDFGAPCSAQLPHLEAGCRWRVPSGWRCGRHPHAGLPCQKFFSCVGWKLTDSPLPLTLFLFFLPLLGHRVSLSPSLRGSVRQGEKEVADRDLMLTVACCYERGCCQRPQLL